MDDAGFPQLVRELMTVGVQTCTPETPILDIVRVMLEKNLEDVLVMEEGSAVGVVGQDELVGAYTNPLWRTLTAGDILRADYLQVPPDMPLTDAVKRMQETGARAIFLTHNAGGMIYPAGYLSNRHILRLLAAKTPADLADLGFAASRQSPLDAFIARRDAASEAARKKRMGN